MRLPRLLKDAEQRGAAVRTYDYHDGSVIAVDLGTSEDSTVDVVGHTAIVVVGDRQFEFELPADATDVSISNGVFTITE
jgi:hypothetical protein